MILPGAPGRRCASRRLPFGPVAVLTPITTSAAIEASRIPSRTATLAGFAHAARVPPASEGRLIAQIKATLPLAMS